MTYSLPSPKMEGVRGNVGFPAWDGSTCTMGNYYPGSGGASAAGRSERQTGARGGATINLQPSEWRRVITNEPPPAANDNARRPPTPANDNGQYRPRQGPPPMAVARLLPAALPYLGMAAGFGLIWIINKWQQGQPGSPAFNYISTPEPGTDWARATETWCEGTQGWPIDRQSSTTWTAGGAGGACIGGQAVATSLGSNLRVGFWSNYLQANNRYAHIRSFTRVAPYTSNVGTRPELLTQPAVDPVPEIPGQYWFEPYPFGRPLPVTRPNPWPRQNPKPENDPDAGNGLNPIPIQRPLPHPNPGARPYPRPNGLPRPGTGPRPPKGKERKIALAIDPRSPMAKAIGRATETLDVLECLHQALPPDKTATRKVYNGRFVKAAMPRKAKAVFDNFASIDLEKALGCMMANYVEDGIFGYAGKLSAKANRRTNRFGGLQLGPAL